MGPVDEQKQMFSLDCYFRQSWRDERLRYNSTRLKELPMNWQFLYKMWRPDTYIGEVIVTEEIERMRESLVNCLKLYIC